MSSTASAAPKATAPWKSAFLKHVLDKMESPEFVLSTLHSAPAGSPTPYVPHARFCIFRGMWAELPENKHNDAPKNEKVFESEMPTFTTDVRMQKIPEIFASSQGHATKIEQTLGSGGGGPVEAVWWVKNTQTQWRIKGEAFIVGPDMEGEGDESSGVRTVKSEVGKRMRLLQEGREGNWSWSKELTGHFGNVSPAMRGSFKQPPPGQAISKAYNENDERMGEKVTTLDDPVSRKNFRVVIIRPEQVEETYLGEPDKAKRKRYSFDSGSNEWTMEETWP